KTVARLWTIGGRVSGPGATVVTGGAVVGGAVVGGGCFRAAAAFASAANDRVSRPNPRKLAKMAPTNSAAITMTAARTRRRRWGYIERGNPLRRSRGGGGTRLSTSSYASYSRAVGSTSPSAGVAVSGGAAISTGSVGAPASSGPAAGRGGGVAGRPGGSP